MTDAILLVGCGNRQGAFDVLDDHRRALTGLDRDALAELVRRFAKAERVHPVVCARRPHRPAGRNTTDFWQIVVACLAGLAADDPEAPARC